MRKILVKDLIKYITNLYGDGVCPIDIPRFKRMINHWLDAEEEPVIEEYEVELIGVATHEEEEKFKKDNPEVDISDDSGLKLITIKIGNKIELSTNE